MPDLKSAPATMSAALLVLAAIVSPARADASKEIGATGTIEPHGGVVMLSGQGGELIRAINVKVGQAVKPGDVLMVLDDRDIRFQLSNDENAVEASRRHAAEQIADSNQNVALAEDRLKNAEQVAKAYEDLGPNATSKIQIENYENGVRDARAALASQKRANATAKADTAADIRTQEKRLKLDRARLAAYTLRAPSPGVVLQVNQHVGEALGGPPIALGDISTMYVVCDAFQGDLLKIQPGMKATVTSSALGQTLTGRVEWVGRFINTKSQTGQFKVKLDDPGVASRLVGMEVNVKVQLGS